MDIRAKQAGVFVKGFAAEGAEVSVGASLYEVDAEGKAAPPSAESQVNAADAQPADAQPAVTAASSEKTDAPIVGEPIEVNVPVMGESITTGLLARWLRREGERVAADEVVASIETDKVTVEVRSPQAGTISRLFSAEAAEVTVGQPLFALVPGEPEATEKPAGSDAAHSEQKPHDASSVRPAEKAGSVYKETTESKKAASEARVQSPATPSPAMPAPPLMSATPGNRSETRVKMTRMRMRISQRLKEAQNTAAMLTTFQEVDMSRLIELRNAHKEQFEKTHGVKLGFMSAFVKVYSQEDASLLSKL